MRKSLWAGVVAAALLLLVPSAFADSGNGRSAVAGSVPPWATAANAKGSTPADTPVGFRVYLNFRDQAGAEALARAVSDPVSTSYGNYLTPGQFMSRFAPAQAQVNAVRSWLASQGFTIDYTPTNNHYVAAEGTAAQVETAFATKLKEYAVAGLTLRAPESALSVPSSIGDAVAGVVGVDESAALVQPLDRADPAAPPSAGFRNAPPCSSYWGQFTQANAGPALPPYDGHTLPYAPCGYTPPQLRETYGVNLGAADGTGVTVAVIDAYASPTIFQDVQQYFANHDSSHPFTQSQFSQVVAPGTYRRPQNPAQDPQGWYGEETLDVEAVHAMAPGAKIVYVGAPNNYRDLDAALNHVVDKHLASIVTNSYGFTTEFLPTGYVKTVNDTLLEAALTGMTVLFSSGDNGDELAFNGYRTVDWPASSPWATAVGGTSLAAGTAPNNGQYLFETGWSTTRNRLAHVSSGAEVCNGLLAAVNTWCSFEVYLYGSGGGASRLFAEPWWQQGVVPADIAQPTGFVPAFTRPGRAVPDISAVGDPNTGMLIGQTQTFSTGVEYGEYRIGGTSLSSPLMAGMFADVQELRGVNNPIGFANPLLYTGGVRSTLHDIQPTGLAPAGVLRADYANSESAGGGILYSVRTLGFHTSPRTIVSPAFPTGDYNATIFTRPGYDDVTGLGTPSASFFSALAAAH